MGLLSYLLLHEWVRRGALILDLGRWVKKGCSVFFSSFVFNSRSHSFEIEFKQEQDRFYSFCGINQPDCWGRCFWTSIDSAKEIWCCQTHPLGRMKNSHPGTSSFFLWRWNNFELVSDGRNWKLSFSRLPEDTFSVLQKLSKGMAHAAHQAHKKLGLWKTSLLCLLPQTCRQRQGQETEESHKTFNPPKGASDGIQGRCFRRIKAESEACIKKQSPKHTQQKKPTKSILGEKEGKGMIWGVFYQI